MRAVVVRAFGPVSAAAVELVEKPEPAPDEVLVRTTRVGVNVRDIMMIEGRHQQRPTLPFIPGMECAGTVEAVGSAVSGFAPGERVAGEVDNGAFADYVCVPASSCYPIPPAMSFEDAAALGLVYQAAHFALADHARVTSGERVLVVGAAGGVGLAATQLARALGARVIAGVRGNEEAVIVRHAGADHVVELGGDDVVESVVAEVLRCTGDYGVDVAIDPVGGEVFHACLGALAQSGRLVSIGFASGQVPSLEVNRLLPRNLNLMGLNWRHYRLNQPERVRAIQMDIYSLYEKGRLAPHVMHVHPLEAFAEALERLQQGRVQGKTVLATA